MTSGFIALPRGSTRWVAAGAICAGYAVLAHLAAADPNPNQLDVGVATVPPVAVSLLLAWRSSQRVLMLLLCLAGTVGLYAAAGWLVGYYNWVFLLQHVGMQVLLGLAFGHTLRASRTPLVSRIAALVHGPLSPTLARYTRQVTWAWTLYFSVTAAVSVLLFGLAPIAAWSVFANLLGLPLLILMFVAEYAVRLCVLAPSERTGLLQAIRAYMRAHPGALPRSM